MKTITIDIINDKVMKILKELELLKLIRMRKEKTQPATFNWVHRYKGSMSKQSITEIDNQLKELRKGWD